MRWKKYTDEQPREEHGRVLVRKNESCKPLISFMWSVMPDMATEWLDHLDDGWIPVSERVPTEEDGRSVNLTTDPVWVDMQSRDGSLFRLLWDSDYFRNGYAIAWRHLPDPYVPPEKPLWESEDMEQLAWDALPREVADMDTFQRELRKRGLEIRKVTD